MNTNYLNSRVVKALSVVAVAVVFFISSPLTSLANDGSKKAGIPNEAVSVQYIGTTSSDVVFRVEFENPTAEKFWLIIRNDAGEVVYRKQFSDTHFAKSVYIQKTDADMNPTFVIRNGENEVVRQFAVSSTVTENTVVTKL